jgi:hypothetical protein
MNDTGDILDAPTLRQRLADSATLHQNDESRMKEKSYLDYLAKDMYYFSRARHMEYGMLDEGVQWVYLCPAGYELKNEKSPVYATQDSFWR